MDMITRIISTEHCYHCTWIYNKNSLLSSNHHTMFWITVRRVHSQKRMMIMHWVIQRRARTTTYYYTTTTIHSIAFYYVALSHFPRQVKPLHHNHGCEIRQLTVTLLLQHTVSYPSLLLLQKSTFNSITILQSIAFYLWRAQLNNWLQQLLGRIYIYYLVSQQVFENLENTTPVPTEQKQASLRCILHTSLKPPSSYSSRTTLS